ncbi:chalcone isomerase family protein [Endozoicomonas sp. ONNA2]|uniref:chalcone isomerase family protein n=1 Tax=Endozoicomonas sp. ONNA2 TaxID=2828741 RepID=UPI0021491D10|nr:chalcone isomerase family protein [Endozoicomonas sp. ONNA2]
MKKNGVRFYTLSQFHVSILLAFLIPLFSIQSFAQNAGTKQDYPVWELWRAVGHATLKWGFWDIYDAQLKTPSGLYDVADPAASDVALVIDYRRKISKKRLLAATDQQWAHLGVSRENRKRWIQQLSKIWKGVRAGDRLVFVLSASGGRFYFGRYFLGKVDDVQLARTFMDIWLSDSTAYPELRQQLIGR